MISVRRLNCEFRGEPGNELVQQDQFIHSRIALHNENRLFRPAFGNRTTHFHGDFVPTTGEFAHEVRDGNNGRFVVAAFFSHFASVSSSKATPKIGSLKETNAVGVSFFGKTTVLLY